MPLSFPVGAREFANEFPIVNVEYEPVEFVDVQGLRRGDMITSQLALPRWRAKIYLAPLDEKDAGVVRAKLNRIGVNQFFYVADPRRPFPLNDRRGTILGQKTVRIDGIDGRMMKFRNFPPEYRITWGDKFHVNYGSNPSRRALFEIASTIQSDGNGNTGWVDVNPYIPLGVHLNDEADFKFPSCLMKRTGVEYGRTAAMMNYDIVFEAMEARRD